MFQKTYARLTLKAKLVLTLLLVFLCIWIGETFANGYFFTQRLEANLKKETEVVASLISQEFDSKKKLLSSYARSIADGADISQLVLAEDKAALLRELIPFQASLNLDLIEIINKKNSILVELRSDEIKTAKLNDENIIGVANQGVNLIDIITTQNNSPSVLVALNSIKSSEEVIGGVITGIAINDDILNQIRAQSQKHLVAFNNSQITSSTLVDANEDDWQAPAINSPPKRLKVAGIEYIAKSIKIDGLNNSATKIIVLNPTEKLHQTENELWLNLGILCLLGVAISTVIGNQITNFIIYRIQYLTKATKRLADGDFTTRIKVNGNDEINVLAQGFNYMIKQLPERDRKIYHQVEELEETKNKLVRREREYSKTLEIKVQERTEELQDKNEQLKETLEQLKAAQTQIIAQEKLASLGSLTAGIAHEINTPIGIGVTAASVLEEKTNVLLQSHESGNMKRSELKKYLNTASQSSQMILGNLNRAAELIQSFKQVAVDQSSEERRVFNIKKYLEEILLQLQPKLNNTKHQINIQGSDYLSIDSYPGVFSQVITNLIMNSLIHAYDDLDSGNIIIKYYQEDTDFVLEYQDDGKGIADENLTKIFEPFFTTKRNQGGTGLGLHIIYNIVTQKLLGDIDCESCLGVGSKFIIKIPITV